jgi:uncharacterized protein (TIGR03067 family)
VTRTSVLAPGTAGSATKRNRIMHWLTLTMCWLILWTGLVPAFAQPAEDAMKKLQGTWTATQAERDGKAADDVVGHRLSFTGNRFQIQSKDGKSLYAGTVRVDPSAKPAAIDFEHTEGALKRKAWKGIYALDGDTPTNSDLRRSPGAQPEPRGLLTHGTERVRATAPQGA